MLKNGGGKALVPGHDEGGLKPLLLPLSVPERAPGVG
jgi:hypothetical protein